MKTYNPWYTCTYEKILGAVNWNDPLSDVELKVALVFSWMPTTIMRHRERHTLAKVKEKLKHTRCCFASLPNSELWKVQNLSAIHQYAIVTAFDALITCFGKVAASKFLHFSRPKFLPMFDSRIAAIESGADYFQFLVDVRKQLQFSRNQAIAKKRYPANLLRGWDIFLMETRDRAKGPFKPTNRIRGPSSGRR